MVKINSSEGINVKRVRLFLSLDPPRTIEGSIVIPGQKVRLSDVLNDDRTFLAIKDFVFLDTDRWTHISPKFLLLNKNEIKAIIEME